MGAKLHWTRSAKTQVVRQATLSQWILALLFLFISLFFNLQARAENSGCAEARLMIKLTQLSQFEEDREQLLELEKKLCGQALEPNTLVKFANGQIATYWLGAIEAEWFYPNGKRAFSGLKKGSVLYYPNGRIATEWSHSSGVPWYHANGKVLSHAAGVKGAQLFTANGESIAQQWGLFEEQKKHSDLNMIDFIEQIQASLRLSSFHAQL